MIERLNSKSQRTVSPRRAATALGTLLALGLVGGGCGENGGKFYEWFMAVYSVSCGNNEEGQGGIAEQDLNTFLTPKGNKQNIRGSDGGAGHTVAISSDGKVFTNGANSFGQLGNGTTTPHIPPAEVPGLTDVVDVQAGWFNTVALSVPSPGLRGRQFGSAAKVYAWGDNFFGQLGDGGVLTHSTTPVLVPIIGNVKGIHMGQWDSVFALMEDGTVQGWGVNANGELGDGTGTNLFSPTPIPGLTNVVQIAGGGQHTLFLLADGTVMATGAGSLGQTGLGHNNNVYAPVQIPGLTNVIHVAAGAEHSIAVNKEGKVFTWGRNFEGQLGSGPTPNTRNVPVEVAGLNCAARAAAGTNFTWIVRWDGSIRSFGDNQYGQLGDGTFVNRNVPTEPANPPARVFHAAAGHNHTLLGGSEEPYTVWTVNRQGVAVQTGDVRYLPISVFEAGSSTPMDTEVVVCSPDGGMLAGLHAYPSHLIGPLTVRVRRHETFLSEVVEVPVPVGGADVNLGVVLLRNGDVNGDNSVGIPDFIQLRNAFGSVPASPNWNPNADLNRDGSVSIADFLIFRSNFGATGE